MAMQDVLPFLNLMKEMQEFLPMTKDDPHFFCMVWEYDSSCIKEAESPKFNPLTKHISLKYHHFRKFVSNGTVKINPIATLDQTATIL